MNDLDWYTDSLLYDEAYDDWFEISDVDSLSFCDESPTLPLSVIGADGVRD